MSIKAHDQPSEIDEAEGEVMMNGPDGVAVSLTPEAAVETGHRLIASGNAATARAKRPPSAPRSRRAGSSPG